MRRILFLLLFVVVILPKTYSQKWQVKGGLNAYPLIAQTLETSFEFSKNKIFILQANVGYTLGTDYTGLTSDLDSRTRLLDRSTQGFFFKIGPKVDWLRMRDPRSKFGFSTALLLAGSQYKQSGTLSVTSNQIINGESRSVTTETAKAAQGTQWAALSQVAINMRITYKIDVDLGVQIPVWRQQRNDLLYNSRYNYQPGIGSPMFGGDLPVQGILTIKYRLTE
jgi:hypothetical protein